MKKLTKILMISAACACIGLSSCQKGFDPKSYAPTKPLPTFGGYSKSADIEPASLVAYWPFNGTLADSLSSTTGVATKTSFNAGIKGQGLQGADNGYVVTDVPAAVKSVHSFTLSTWVKMPQNTSALGVLSIANDQIGGPGFWGSLDIFFDNGSANTATTGILKVHAFSIAGSPNGVDAWEGGYVVANPWNNWINILVTYDDVASTVTVYYNGAVAGTNTVPTFKPLDWSNATKMVFGTLQFQTTPSLTANTGAQGWAGYLTGTLDQVRIYNKVLSATEVSALYNLEKLGR